MRLVQGETYYWAAALICHASRRTEDWVVGGWIRYQPLPSTQATTALINSETVDSLSSSSVESEINLEQLTAQINHYMETGYWYDALAMLLPLVQGSSSSLLESTWVALLSQANLSPVEMNLNDGGQTVD